MAKYAYDAWGKCAIVEDTSERGIATINPYRYRSYYYDPEIGMYYLQSRYYDPVCAQWINSDNIMCCGIGGKPASFNLFCYCNNNGATYADCSGFMPVSTLRMVSTIYSSGVVGAQVASMSVLALNGLGIYTAFHEIAQINIAKKLGSKGFRDIVLEYGIPGKGEADIVARRGWKRYVWEVKPIFGNASKQLEKYTNRTGLIRGYSIGTISNITRDPGKFCVIDVK